MAKNFSHNEKFIYSTTCRLIVYKFIVIQTEIDGLNL